MRKSVCSCNCPSSAWAKPPRIFSKEDLPAPLRPIRPTRSAPSREKSVWSNKATWPNASCAFNSVMSAIRGKLSKGSLCQRARIKKSRISGKTPISCYSSPPRNDKRRGGDSEESLARKKIFFTTCQVHKFLCTMQGFAKQAA